jgi:hypothetical protein
MSTALTPRREFLKMALVGIAGAVLKSSRNATSPTLSSGSAGEIK